jgi:hypothetical protein
MVKLTEMMNFHIDPFFVNVLYQKVELDFANKGIDPDFNNLRVASSGLRFASLRLKNSELNTPNCFKDSSAA